MLIEVHKNTIKKKQIQTKRHFIRFTIVVVFSEKIFGSQTVKFDTSSKMYM